MCVGGVGRPAFSSPKARETMWGGVKPPGGRWINASLLLLRRRQATGWERSRRRRVDRD